MGKFESKKARSIFWELLFGVLIGIIVAIFLFRPGFLNKPAVIERPISQNEAKKVHAASSVEEDITLSRQNAIVKAAQKVGPTVVSISVVQVRVVRESPFFPPFGDEFFDEFWGGFFRPREYKEKIYSIGSGVIINPDGYVLTNEHVVMGADQLKVTLTTGEEYQGKVVGQDQASDLAVVKIDAKNLPYASLGNSDDLIIGEWAIAVGNPFGYLLDDPQPTVTVGVISAVNRDIKRERGQVQIYRKMIQTDAAINPGNSGGPLVNADGEVIGINTFIFTTSRGSEGIGFAIPINRAKAILSDLIKHGEVERTWIGAKVQDLTPLLAQSLELENTQGVIVSDVEEESPAQKAGFKRKDVIINANNQKIRNSSDWEDLTYLARTGERIDISLLRNGKEVHTKLVPESIPTQTAKKSQSNLEMTVANITPAIANQLGIYDRRGVVITSVEKGSLAYNSGLGVGDIVRQIGDTPIQSVEDYENILRKNKSKDKLIMLIEREGSLYYVTFGTQ
jgi:serine protease Do